MDRFELENSSLATLAGRRIFHEEVAVQRAADRLHPAASGGRHERGGGLPQGGHQRGDLIYSYPRWFRQRKAFPQSEGAVSDATRLERVNDRDHSPLSYRQDHSFPAIGAFALHGFTHSRNLPFWRQLEPALIAQGVELTVHFAPSHPTSYEVVCGDIALEAMLSRRYPIIFSGRSEGALADKHTQQSSARDIKGARRDSRIQGDCEVSLVIDRKELLDAARPPGRAAPLTRTYSGRSLSS